MSGEEERKALISKLSDLAILGLSVHLVDKELRIDGVEVSQAIQYYHAHRHLTDPADRGPDNSLGLVAYKPAWVRVYVRGAIRAITGVRGVIEVSD